MRRYSCGRPVVLVLLVDPRLEPVNVEIHTSTDAHDSLGLGEAV